MSSKVLKDVDIEQELLGIENECGELPNTLEDRCFTPLTLQDLGVKPDFGVNCDPGLLEIPKCYDEDDIIRQSRNELTSENNIEEPDCNHDVVDPYSSDDDEQDPNWNPDVKKRIRFTDPTIKRIKRKKTDKNIKRKKKVNIIMSDDEDEDDQPLATLKQLKNIKLQLQNHTELPLRNQDSQEINLFYEEDETPCEKLPHQNIRENNGETMERPSNIKERSPEEAPLQKIERPLDSQEKTAEETPAQNIEIPPSNEERLAEEATAQNIERPSDNEQRLAEEAPAQNIERPSDNEQRLAEEAPAQNIERPSDNEQRLAEEAPAQNIERPSDNEERLAEEAPAQNIERPSDNEQRLAEEAPAQNIERPSDNEQRLAEEAPAQNIERPSDNEERLAEEAPAQNIERPSDNEERLAEEAPAQNIERPSDNEQRLAEEAPAQNIERPSDNEERLAEEVPAQNMDSFSKSRRDNRTARTLGQPYLGFKKVENKFEMCVNKPARTLKERCHHSNMIYKSKNTFLCALITDEEREVIHKSFWDLKTWQEKKGFVKGSAKRRGIRRRRKTSARSIKKTSGHDFTLCHLRVCKKFYLNTLCIGEDSVRRWTKEFDIVFENDDVDAVTGQVNLRRSTVCSVMRMKIKEWLDLLPKVPSHYCRASSKKLYVESTFRSLLHMYTIYKEWCDENNEKAASRMTFQKVLAQENVSIHHPRKDQCDTCCSYKTGNISKESYDEHIQKKNEAREAKRKAITKASNSESDDVVVITVDVQSVLLTPKLLASAVYYKQKLQCHNFTVYNTKTKHVTIYFWHEADGNVTANEFTSCLVDYIKTLPEGTKKVIVISDGCGHQNRNRILSSALSDLSMEKGITIQQLYLEKGHTMMEVDSVHSTIEQYIKPPIYAPTDYITRMRQARPQQPYEIKSLHYDFFLNYEELDSNLKSIRPGKKKGDPVVVDIRALKYKEDGSILFKLRHTDSWTTLPQRRRIPRGGSILPKNLYTERIKITESKFKHLQELKSVMDEDYHPFYDSLNYIPGV